MKYEKCTWCGLNTPDLVNHRKTHSKAINYYYEYSKSPVQHCQNLEDGKMPIGWGRCA